MISSAAARIALLLFGCVALQGCESIQTTTDWDRSFAFTGYDTFAWIGEHPLVQKEAGVSPLAEQRIERAVTDVLATKGIRLVADQSQADFVVAFGLGSREKVSVTTNPYPGGYWGRPGYWGGPYYQDVDVRQYTQGRLAIDIFDVKEHRPVWHGYATKNITADVRSNPEKHIRDAVAAILKSFPPGTATTK